MITAEDFQRDAMQICLNDCASKHIAHVLLDAYNVYYESSEGSFRLDARTYDDFLEGHRLGHRQLRLWLREDAEGVATPTRRGSALFARVEALLEPASV